MMKKITYILGLFSMLTFQSCLDMEPKTQLADTNYWQTPDHFKLFATQFYGWTVDFKQLDDSLIVMFVLICGQESHWMSTVMERIVFRRRIKLTPIITIVSVR